MSKKQFNPYLSISFMSKGSTTSTTKSNSTLRSKISVVDSNNQSLTTKMALESTSKEAGIIINDKFVSTETFTSSGATNKTYPKSDDQKLPLNSKTNLLEDGRKVKLLKKTVVVTKTKQSKNYKWVDELNRN